MRKELNYKANDTRGASTYHTSRNRVGSACLLLPAPKLIARVSRIDHPSCHEQWLLPYNPGARCMGRTSNPRLPLPRLPLWRMLTPCWQAAPRWRVGDDSKTFFERWIWKPSWFFFMSSEFWQPKFVWHLKRYAISKELERNVRVAALLLSPEGELFGSRRCHLQEDFCSSSIYSSDTRHPRRFWSSFFDRWCCVPVRGSQKRWNLAGLLCAEILCRQFCETKCNRANRTRILVRTITRSMFFREGHKGRRGRIVRVVGGNSQSWFGSDMFSRVSRLNRQQPDATWYGVSGLVCLL